MTERDKTRGMVVLVAGTLILTPLMHFLFMGYLITHSFSPVNMQTGLDGSYVWTGVGIVVGVAFFKFAGQRCVLNVRTAFIFALAWASITTMGVAIYWLSRGALA